MRQEIAFFLCGDVMTGRGIDQLLPRPCEPTLYEPCVTSANEYVALAESANGPLPRSVDFGYPWGEAIAELEDRKPDLRIINLETSVTRHSEPEPKGINYRMSPIILLASRRPGSIVARSPTITFSIGAKLACWTRSPQSKRRVSQPQARGGM